MSTRGARLAKAIRAACSPHLHDFVDDQLGSVEYPPTIRFLRRVHAFAVRQLGGAA